SDMITGFDSSTHESEQEVTTTIKDRTTTFTFDIVAKAAESIELISAPTKLEYVVGQALDLTGAEVTVTYNDGTTATIPVTSEMITGFDSSAPESDQVVTVTIDGAPATFTVDIIA